MRVAGASETDRAGRSITILIAAGGTGGHVLPALAVAGRLRDRGARVVWLGTRGGLDAKIVPQHDIEARFLTISGFRGAGPSGWLLGPARLLFAIFQAILILRRHGAALVLGMGGYASAPGGVAARVLGIPLVVHEQNAIPGTTNRLLAPLAAHVLEAFPGSFPVERRAVHTGNPVRADIAGIQAPDARLGGRRGPLRVLVLGGSQGARALNEAVPRAIAVLKPSAAIVEVRHQAGQLDVVPARSRYLALGINVEPVAYIDDMAAAYAWSDLVICRAGATTVAELAVAGAASILVPFPFAVDDHQTRNARFLSRVGAAVLLPQGELSPSRLARLITEFYVTRDRLVAMASAARSRAVADAAERVAGLCLEAAGG